MLLSVFFCKKKLFFVFDTYLYMSLLLQHIGEKMSQGIAVVNGTTPVHKLLKNGVASFSGSVEVTGSIIPEGDVTRELGSSSNRWHDIYSLQTTVGAIFEYGLETPGIGEMETGTVLCWHNGQLRPSETKHDSLVIGVVQKGKDQPIIIGAEFILVTGEVKEGDFLVTSDKKGHAMSAWNAGCNDGHLFGKTIGQALQNSSGESNLIKCMISKR